MAENITGQVPLSLLIQVPWHCRNTNLTRCGLYDPIGAVNRSLVVTIEHATTCVWRHNTVRPLGTAFTQRTST
eukprot:CAMPEP_0197629258 /NCGR_PEP_ID=MMETSP1338-20131121/7191_1 /TAXON_ID=43686 ORGANISM="Pelagodinium beii, Strain RCC1491" /NCGR_SAMPLE_ID=MMETSP1338 /ASSEMBLY_ACC=CAM_ASM_000754 /LENGTH=72 /DNA_ID=CAMNT_0043200285 /DNA_START=209 /DNA_END=424 /DNA_ORIENTATION=-